MTLTQMREILAGRAIQLTKSLGQNFLHDSGQLRRIVNAAELSPTDRVLEVGPGLGPLTELLLPRAAHVLAIEKDARLVEVLCDRFHIGHASGLPPELQATPLSPASPAIPVATTSSNLELIQADALRWLEENPRDWRGWKLVANLPYSIASTLLVELAQTEHPPDRLVATLQIEVARRLDAKPDGDDYGLLTLLVQLRYESRGYFRIPATCFFPVPEVESACVTLVRRERELLPFALHPTFTRLVKLALSQRRKMMAKLLRRDWPRETIERELTALGVSLQERAEKLSLEQFVELTQRLGPPGPPNLS
ncbi:MAG: ribosomal RNA small subunit methyltransferase A [Verrucomicrobia bacterium]|nr:ribosomal RNA small subunit methyltransferase A [Verrucomicrobiota bacterium]